MTRWAMVIDLDACTGCGACTVACRQENNVPIADEEAFFQGRNLDWIQLVTELEGDYETLEARQYPLLCLHCDEPPCINVCPVWATYRDAEGIVGQIYPRCIGCRYCTNACPYSVKAFNWFAPSWPAGMERRHNPDVSVRPKGVVEKCTFCVHRRQKAKEEARVEGRAFQERDYVPACVEICPAQAMVFGNLDDPNSEVHELAMRPDAERLLEDLGTEPKVVFLPSRRGGQ
ncbi:MAG: 4Fe-4S dicluster domain-containing protein [Deltaproteobacteria bacterium]|nr:MAG: 4Fe-4S dicluster domain-containing protein [Deltaproteobacteria bacterium]